MDDAFEIEAPSLIRQAAFAVTSISGMMKPGIPTSPSTILMLAKTGKDLEDLAARARTYFETLRQARQERRLAASKAAITRAYAPRKRRR